SRAVRSLRRGDARADDPRDARRQSGVPRRGGSETRTAARSRPAWIDRDDPARAARTHRGAAPHARRRPRRSQTGVHVSPEAGAVDGGIAARVAVDIDGEVDALA